MTWTAKIIKAEKRSDKWKAIVEYSNGTDSFFKDYLLDHLDSSGAAGMLCKKLAELEDFETVESPFPLGVELTIENLTPAPPEPPPEPTQAELDRKAWFDNYNLFYKTQRMVEIGVSTQSEVDAIKATLTAGYLPEYGDSL